MFAVVHPEQRVLAESKQTAFISMHASEFVAIRSHPGPCFV